MTHGLDVFHCDNALKQAISLKYIFPGIRGFLLLLNRRNRKFINFIEQVFVLLEKLDSIENLLFLSL